MQYKEFKLYLYGIEMKKDFESKYSEDEFKLYLYGIEMAYLSPSGI